MSALDAIERSTEPVTDPEFVVPEGEGPKRCPYCERPFRTDRKLTFHVGVRHAERCSEEEREAYEVETDDEEHELFTFHLKAAVSVFLVYFMFTFLYALAWAG